MTMKKHARIAITAFVAGLVAVSSALAGIIIAPQVPKLDTPDAASVARAAGVPLRSSSAASISLEPADVAGAAASTVKAPAGGRTPDGTFLVGAARVNLEPGPTLFGGQTWQREGCTRYDDSGVGGVNQDHVLPPLDDPSSALDEIRGWPASSPDCVYLGGFGIGPSRPAEGVGPGGVWIRAIAISNGEETFVYEIADLVGWFARYDSMICADCGIRDVRKRLASDLGVDIGDVMAGSTHSHAGADSYGGWGGIPKWYRNQIRDSAVAAAKQAVANLVPATLQSGEVHLRNRNNERRDHYYSTVDTGATWLQAKTLEGEPHGCDQPASTATLRRQRRPDRTPRPTPTATACVPVSDPPEVIATLATYAAHPTIVGDPVLHADWPGATARAFEARYGGVGLTFEGGLGNASVSGLDGPNEPAKAEATGKAIADDVAASISDDPRPIISNAMAASVSDITHPVMTNPGLITLGAFGLFDREFLPGSEGAGLPGVYHWSKSDLPSDELEGGYLRGCSSAGPTIITTTGAHRIGDLLIAFAPGEIFSNIAEVVKERADNDATAMVIGQTNDALGYLIQSFEFDLAANVVTEYGTKSAEYEEVFAVDRCIGDHVLETLLDSTSTLGFGG